MSSSSPQGPYRQQFSPHSEPFGASFYRVVILIIGFMVISLFAPIIGQGLRSATNGDDDVSSVAP